MKRTLKICIALLMAVVMTMNLPMGAYAATKEQTYISEVKIGYDDAGKKALKEAGYTVVDKMNLNSGGKGYDVWLGYKTTFNSDEAITDMALMNQGTGYSFQGWCDELDKMQEKISGAMDRFEATILEYQKNLKAGSPYAVMARKFLNCYIDDDLNPNITDETGYLLGDLFEKYGATPAEGEKAVTKDSLVTLFMQGNTTLLKTIYDFLALSLVEYSEDFSETTFIDRMREVEYDETLDPKVTNISRGLVTEALIDARASVLNLENDLKAKGLYEAFIKRSDYDGMTEGEKAESDKLLEDYYKTLDDSKKAEFASLTGFYLQAGKTPYTSNLDPEGEGFTLLDLLKLPVEEPDDESLFISDEMMDPLVRSLTAGQIGAMENTGFVAVFSIVAASSTKEASDKYLGELEELYAELTEKMEGDTVSVYDGVDRELFYDRDTVALTSEALNDKAQSAKADFGKKTEIDEDKNTVIKLIASVLTVVGGAVFGLSFLMGPMTTTGLVAREVLGYLTLSSGTAINLARMIVTGVSFIALVAGLTVLILSLCGYWEKEHETEAVTFTYSKIPRVLMDLRYKGVGNKEKYYVAYYAAENIALPDYRKITDFEPGSEFSLIKYGDLNGLCNECAWLTLYTTKDANAGTPLLADLLISNSSTPEKGYEDYDGVHMFWDTNAANLNQLQLNGAGAVYLFMQHSVASETQEPSDGTMSVFVKNPSVNAALAMGLFAVGAMVSGFAVAGYYKKKERYTA